MFSSLRSIPPTGGSAKVFSLSNKRYQLLVSPVVLTEVEKNVRQKLTDQVLERFFILVKKVKVLKQEPGKQLIAQAQEVIVKKDAVILAEAKKAKVDYLLTLDRKHFCVQKVRNFVKPCKIVTPKEFLKSYCG